MSSMRNPPPKFDRIIQHEVNMLPSNNVSSIRNSAPKLEEIIQHKVNVLPSDNVSSIRNLAPKKHEFHKELSTQARGNNPTQGQCAALASAADLSKEHHFLFASLPFSSLNIDAGDIDIR
ncbi:hypothetical protein ACROYT_G037010 [Oculina patagonica]